jgi:Lon-like ATP-dependent protease
MAEEDAVEEVITEDDSEMVTVWAPEPTKDGDELLSSSIDSWIEEVKFETTEDVPIPERLVDQVIGQEAGSVVIRKAAEQRRHMLMIGDPGTGKSMLARSMTDLLPQDALEDVLVYPNEDDENEPRVRSVPAGRAERIVRIQKEAIREQKEKAQRMLLIGFGAVAFLLVIVAIPTGDILTLLFGMFLLMFGYMFIRSRLGSGDEGRIPKVLVKHDLDERPPFVDATATLSGSPFIEPTKVFSTLTKSTFCDLKSNRHYSLRCKSGLSQSLVARNALLVR